MGMRNQMDAWRGLNNALTANLALLLLLVYWNAVRYRRKRKEFAGQQRDALIFSSKKKQQWKRHVTLHTGKWAISMPRWRQTHRVCSILRSKIGAESCVGSIFLIYSFFSNRTALNNRQIALISNSFKFYRVLDVQWSGAICMEYF